MDQYYHFGLAYWWAVKFSPPQPHSWRTTGICASSSASSASRKSPYRETLHRQRRFCLVGASIFSLTSFLLSCPYVTMEGLGILATLEKISTPSSNAKYSSGCLISESDNWSVGSRYRCCGMPDNFTGNFDYVARKFYEWSSMSRRMWTKCQAFVWFWWRIHHWWSISDVNWTWIFML
jgi:hypothetical protein